jgi:hypothetical protein
MSFPSYRRLAQDLYWGQRLLLESIRHHAHGFRGNAKDGGFRAYLKAENIPPRKAYRLIERYRRMRTIWDRVADANAALEKEIIPVPSGETIEKLEAALQAMWDADRDTNEECA